MPSLIARALVDEFRPRRHPARLLYRSAAFLLASALFHLGVLVVTGLHWSGAVSYRKPLVFAASIGVLLPTFGWVLDQLPDRRRLATPLAWTMLVSSSLEVGLITVQAWRGTASHFNVARPLDAAIFSAMGSLVTVMSACLIVLLVWFLRRPGFDRLLHRAVAAGLWLMMIGLGLGYWIIQLGNRYVNEHDAVPQTVTYGAGGVAKLPHAVALHGLQVFIVAAVLLRRSRWASTMQSRVLTVVVVLYSALLAAVLGQTLTGRSPLEPGWWSMVMAASSAGLVVTFVAIVGAFRVDASPVASNPPVLVG
jgi:hypothetical protein